MKFTKIAVAVACAFAFGNAYAFHDGGVATCDGCHTMHNSSGNKIMLGNGGAQTTGTPKHTTAGTQFQGTAFLLQGTDQSSTCLNCHSGATLSSYHVLTYPLPGSTAAPINRTPGGDFGWLAISYAANSGAHTSAVAAERHGHNIVANDFGLVADTLLTSAPGGDYDAGHLSCVSCHDPHSRARIIDANGTLQYNTIGGAAGLPISSSGSYGAYPGDGTIPTTEAVGVYRLLGGSNYTQMSYQPTTKFNSSPPLAVAPSSYNRTEATTDTRVAYGKGMSEWCANCHRQIHNDNTNAANTAFIHPAGNGALLSAAANNLAGDTSGVSTIADIYNAYVKSGDLSGKQGTSYTSLVPYEEGASSTLATLKPNAVTDGSVTTGPVAGANVMCLSCHRAHASGFSSMTRWDNTTEYITEGGVYMNASSGSTTQYTAAMYDRPATVFASAQRSLCNKCHAKD